MIKSKETQKTQIIFFTILVVLISTMAVSTPTSFDAYWHIKVGEWIVEHKQIPFKGIFSYTNGESAWISHEWISSTIIYLIFSFSGWPGLIFMTILSVTLTMLLMLRYTLRYVSANVSFIFMLLGFLLLIPHIIPRPHILALPILVYWTSRLIDASDNQTAPPLYLSILMILWVNMHGSFILGIVFSVFFGMESICSCKNHTIRIKVAKQWTVFISLTIVLTLLNPHGYNALLLPFQIINLSSLTVATEWASANFQSFNALELWLLALFTLCFTFGIKLPLFRMVFILGLIHLSLKHIRHSADILSFVSPLVLAKPFSQQLSITKNTKLNEFFNLSNFQKFLSLSFITSLFIYLINFQEIEDKKNIKISKILTSLSLNKQQLGNVLNSYNFGGILIHYDYKTYIDSRMEVYGENFIGHYFDTINFVNGAKPLEKLIKENHIQWTFFETTQAINTYMATKNDWSKLYSDSDITIYNHDNIHINSSTMAKLLDIKTSSKLEKYNY